MQTKPNNLMQIYQTGHTEKFFHELELEAKGLYTGFWLSDFSNMAALIFNNFPDLNWAGFYFLNGKTLRLGPFQGKVACVEIPVGKGVCGEAVAQKKSILVPDVHLFPGHIACDSLSESELVIPLIKNDTVIGVLDLDSPHKNRFTPSDRQGFESLMTQLLVKLNTKDLQGPLNIDEIANQDS